ncbi:HupE/UreJ family protein [Amycolatopsis plumensis]|uniref:HupE/UreJ family protein n=1 Tax=Amycolatopsis plumensis TaxID=236508 RepID=A0ABV5UII4_9PSEU
MFASRVMPRLAVGIAVLVSVVVFAPAASAHGISGSAADKSTLEFIPLGIEHMLLGWDHLLFIAGIVLLAGELRRAAKLISVFVLGHSTTLIAATLAGWRVDATVVDIVIALSLVFVGVVGWFGRPTRWRWFGLGVFAFGLVHGLGLSTRLQDLGLPEDGLFGRVIAFNVGVEIGQLLAIAVMIVLGKLAARVITWSRAHKAAHGGLVAAGLVAAVVLSVVAVTAAPADAIGSCSVRPRTETYPGGEGGHPDRDFYEPTEAFPATDFGHVLGDGFVLVHYQPTITPQELTELRAFVTGPDGQRVIGGVMPQQTEKIKAINARTTLTCDRLDIAALKEFKSRWFADPQSRPAG